MNSTRFSVAVRNLPLSVFLIAPFLFLVGCGSYNSGGGGANAPYISNLSPGSGPVGTSVTISGNYFGTTEGSSTVTFNGTAATPTSWSNTSIVVPVPSGATTGNVVVSVGGFKASNGMTFIVTSGAPSITTQPINQMVTVGQTATFSVTATGTAPLNYQWKKGGLAITNATSASYTTPPTTTSDNGAQFTVVVSNSVGSVTSNPATLTVNAASAPSITNLSPNSGGVGTSVTITGTNFGTSQGSSTVTFNGTAATVSASNWTATSIITSVPTGATTGNVVVTVGGVASNGVSFTVTGSTTAKWPIKANGRYFTDSSTPPNPWLLVGDSAHHIVNVLAPSSWPTYFASRQSQGFNMVNFIELTHGNPVANGGLPNGQLPFTGMLPSLCNGGASNPDYDLATPNPNFWSVVDQFINMAATYNMVVLLDPLPPSSFINDMRTSGSSKVNGFGQFLGMRYKNSPNIIWELGNDFQTWRNTSGACAGATPDNTLVQQMMAGIASTDPNHLITIQLDYFRSYSNQDTAMDAYLTADGVYTYYETYDYALQAYNSTSTGVSPTPSLLLEANMEGANNTNQLSCSTTAADAHVLREQMYWMMTSGASGHVWGNTHVNHFDSTWQSQLNTTATTQVAMLTTVFNQLRWWKLVPDTAHKVVTAGFGTQNVNNENLCNSTYATAAWVPDSATPTLAAQAIVYTPVAATAPALSVNMGMFSKAMNASWYDPTTGTSQPINGSPFSNTGTQTFTTPGNGHVDGTHDWVLVLQ